MSMGSVFLTFDMDWACDEVMEEFLGIMDDLDVHYTINVTHYTRFLDQMRNDNRVELGIHPNFNPLLAGEPYEGIGVGYIEIIEKLMHIVPEAVTSRSHSLTDSTPISKALYEKGIRYNLNYYIPPTRGNTIHGYRDFTGLLRLPFCFEDDIWFSYDPGIVINDYFRDQMNMPLIFNFHPIHIFLNTESTQTYEKARPFYSGGMANAIQLNKLINHDKYGSRDWLLDIVRIGKKDGYSFLKIREGEW